MNFSTRCCYTA